MRRAISSPYCQMAGRPCERFATRTVFIAGVGRRDLCEVCHLTLDRMGFEFRPVRVPQSLGGAA